LKTFLVKNLGCKVNQYEGQVLREQLEKRGLHEARPDEPCDLVVVNTCTVTGEADRKSRYELRKFNRTFPEARIVATGCYAERDKEALKQIEGISAVVGQREKTKLLDYVDGWLRDVGNFHPMQREDSDLEWGISRFPGRARAFVKIQDGCNKACTFCKVVIVRGGLRSRTVPSIIEEAKRVLEAGYKEIVLTGIQLGAFGKERSKRGELVELLKDLVKLDDLLRLRLSSINPYGISDELIEFVASEPKCCSHFHIPLQSGSNTVLERMKRGYVREFYIERVRNLRSRVPDFELTLDCMAGFPGETESEFEETLSLLREVKPLKIHAFPYSLRPGTRASRFSEHLSPSLIQERMDRISEVGKNLRKERLGEYLGRKVSFLVEEFDEESRTVRGVTSNYLPIVAYCRGTACRASTLLGEMIHSSVIRVDSDLLFAEVYLN